MEFNFVFRVMIVFKRVYMVLYSSNGSDHPQGMEVVSSPSLIYGLEVLYMVSLLRTASLMNIGE